MNRLKIIYVIIILTSLSSCEPSITFSEPQPSDTKNISEFPNRLQGYYLSLSNSSTLKINNKLIQRIYDFDYVIHPNQLDSTTRLLGDTLIDIETNERELIRRDGDSLFIHIQDIDTLFCISYDNVVRKAKGYFFLNTRYSKNGWTVKKLQLSKGQLVISTFSLKQDIENLKEITESQQDTVAPFNFHATKRQFKKFVRKDGFSDNETFVRQKK